MKIGFVGAGNIGQALAGDLVAAGHEVALSNSRGPETLADVVASLGEHAQAVGTEEAIAFGDLVVVTIPLRAVSDLPAEAFDGRIVVDTCNYYPARDGQIAELDDDSLTESELVARLLPGARVVKAFNSIFFKHLAEQGDAAAAPGTRRGIPVASDHPAAKQLVEELIDEIGFDFVDAGPLAAGRDFQNGADLYGAELTGDALAAALGRTEAPG
ncbi:MAG: NADPH-dependent F420 reductase [Solirubrobacteraceae bacterium]|nr:NADPH-dependent F420 reductase [Solirubrobacteraceae bacterium]